VRRTSVSEVPPFESFDQTRDGARGERTLLAWRGSHGGGKYEPWTCDVAAGGCAHSGCGALVGVAGFSDRSGLSPNTRLVFFYYFSDLLIMGPGLGFFLGQRGWFVESCETEHPLRWAGDLYWVLS
jgi:hypothetical protein